MLSYLEYQDEWMKTFPKWLPFLQPSLLQDINLNFAQNLINNYYVVLIYNQIPLLPLSVSYEIIYSLISMASSSIIPRHHCFATTPILFHSNTFSKRLTCPLSHTNVVGFRGFSVRCSYQPPPHHSEFQNKHVSFLKI